MNYLAREESGGGVQQTFRLKDSYHVDSVQSHLSPVNGAGLFVTSWTAACQGSLSVN